MGNSWQQATMLLKRLSGVVSDGMLFSGRPDLLRMDLDRDFPEINRLFEQEDWPFLRSDLEVSLAQPSTAAFVAKKDDAFAGFFLAHHFGDIGYLNMMIVAPGFRNQGIARPLYFRTVRELRSKGIHSLVVYCTKGSSPIIRMLGFREGQTFTLLARDPGHHGTVTNNQIESLTAHHHGEIAELDAEVFGLQRREWISSLLEQSTIPFYGLRENGQLVASLCLRPRKNNAVCIDMANGVEFGYLRALLEEVLVQTGDHSVECFAKTGSDLHRLLLDRDFEVPDYFEPIGPLTECTKGDPGQAGRSAMMQCLSWF